MFLLPLCHCEKSYQDSGIFEQAHFSCMHVGCSVHNCPTDCVQPL